MYKKTSNNIIIRLLDGAYIPCVDGNMDYEEYKNWLEDGNTPEPAKSQEEIEAEARALRLAEIDARLSEIDKLKVRPLSELILDPASEFARDKLTYLELEAHKLRDERVSLIL